MCKAFREGVLGCNRVKRPESQVEKTESFMITRNLLTISTDLNAFLCQNFVSYNS